MALSVVTCWGRMPVSMIARSKKACAALAFRRAQAVAHSVAHGQDDHVVREAMVREGTGGTGGEALATGSAAPALPTKSRLPIVAGIAARPHRMHGMTSPF